MTAAASSRFALAPGVVFQELPDGAAVLLAAHTETYYALSATGSLIVQALRTGDVASVAHTLCRRYGIDEVTARADVGSLLDELVQEGLLHPLDPG